MAKPRRADRLNELFRRELSELVRTELKDPGVRGVTIVDVRTSPDGSHARVFVRAVPPHDVSEAIAGLERAHGFIRRALGQALHLRKIPDFHFEVDHTLERADRIEELLREAGVDDT